MKEIITKAEEFALSEIKKYGLPGIRGYNLSNRKGVELSKKLGADADIVSVGTRLMDIKLGEAFSKGKLKEHVKMGVDTTREFLSQFHLTEDVKEKVINCVEGHHGTKEWICKEAEICANADCYRFLLVKNWLGFLTSLGAEEAKLEENLKLAEEKAEEKWDILSIDICKKELEPHHKLIKEIISKARTS